MADLSDVEEALSAFVVSVLYPAGPNSAGMSGQPVRVYRGWPVSGALELDLAAGVSNVSVFAMPSTTRNTTRWAPVVQAAVALPTMSASVLESSATFSGSADAGQLAGLLVDGVPFVYRTKAGDTPALVAAVLADAVRAIRACWLSGTTVSVPGAIRMLARVCADAAMFTEWGRQEQEFRISVWCPDPGSRDRICSAVGAAFSELGFLTLADGSSGRVRYRSTSVFDEAQNAQLYRRDLLFRVEYATSIVQSAPSMLFGDVQLDGTDLYG